LMPKIRLPELPGVELEFPDWLPRSVIQVAATQWQVAEVKKARGEDVGLCTEVEEVVLRSARDPRLQTVWDELRKEHHKAKADAVWSFWLKIFGEMPEHGPRDPKDMAVALFFHEACAPVIAGLVYENELLLELRKDKLQREVDAHRRQAQQLDVRAGIVPWNTVPGLPEAARLAGIFLELDAPEQRRDRGNRAPRLYVRELASTMRLLFGKVMHTTIATTANVVAKDALRWKSEITREDVRNWASREH
jgi:hypothetical protein